MCPTNCLCDEIGCMREIRFFLLCMRFKQCVKMKNGACMHAYTYRTHPVQMDKKNVGLQERVPYSDETTSHIFLLINRESVCQKKNYVDKPRAGASPCSLIFFSSSSLRFPSGVCPGDPRIPVCRPKTKSRLYSRHR